MNKAIKAVSANGEYIGTSIKEVFIETATKTIHTRNYSAKAANEIANLEPCPRWVDDVYTLGISMQNYISDIYLDHETLSDGSQKILYKNLALKQLIAKEEIRSLANNNLNQLLTYFYDNGGPIMDPPVTEKMAREIQPFFNRIAANFLNQLDIIVNMASKGTMNANELNDAIDGYINAMYTTMGKLFPVQEMQDAFNRLVTVRQAPIMD